MRVISNTRCTAIGPRTSTSRRSYSVSRSRNIRIARRPEESRKSSAPQVERDDVDRRLALEPLELGLEIGGRVQVELAAQGHQRDRAPYRRVELEPRHRRASLNRAGGGEATEMARLRRADCSGPGITRKRAGSGFAYYDDEGRKVTEPEVLARIRELGIPPAWKDVWICPHPERAPAGDRDRRRRAQAVPLPRGLAHAPRRGEVRRHDPLRPRAARAARARRGGPASPPSELTRERVLACAVRLLDRGFFRIGTEEYTDVLRAGHDPQGAREDRRRADALRLPGQERSAADHGGRRPAGDRHRVRAQAPPRRRGRPARLQVGPRLVRRALRRHQRLPEAGHRRRLLGQGLPDLERDRARRGRARRLRPRAGHEDLTQARDTRAIKETALLPRQHARGLPRRPTSTRASSTPSAAAWCSTSNCSPRPPSSRRRCPTTTRRSSGRCSTCSTRSESPRVERLARLGPRFRAAGRAAAAVGRSAAASRGRASGRPGRSARRARRASPARAERSAWAGRWAAERSCASSPIRRRRASPARSG